MPLKVGTEDHGNPGYCGFATILCAMMRIKYVIVNSQYQMPSDVKEVQSL